MHRLFLRRSPSNLLRACLVSALLAVSVLASCRSPQVTGEDITISVTADGETHNLTVPAGSTVTQALQSAGITVGNMDRVEPPPYTVLGDGSAIELTAASNEWGPNCSFVCRAGCPQQPSSLPGAEPVGVAQAISRPG